MRSECIKKKKNISWIPWKQLKIKKINLKNILLCNLFDKSDITRCGYKICAEC